MRISINVTNYSWPGSPRRIGPQLVRLVGFADSAGMDPLWVNDRLMQAHPTAEPGQMDVLEA